LNSDRLALEHTELYSSDDHHKMSLYHLGTVVAAANSTPETRFSRLKKMELNNKFIHGLFTNVVSSSDYIASNGGM
jgi:hypothetical protein